MKLYTTLCDLVDPVMINRVTKSHFRKKNCHTVLAINTLIWEILARLILAFLRLKPTGTKVVLMFQKCSSSNHHTTQKLIYAKFSQISTICVRSLLTFWKITFLIKRLFYRHFQEPNLTSQPHGHADVFSVVSFVLFCSRSKCPWYTNRNRDTCQCYPRGPEPLWWSTSQHLQ